ncbi:Mrp/NBP35 family ATP-binding protein [Brevibacterium sp. 50QC2O2]|uniref:Mrp/NBP35 family ATP-binding protein n=1 Tax=Brevibacterium sp. 50QC2O2 TaxID=2968459 RepID=UPI00211D14AB|nr:Mrp/NBP35 family ATP-binding protein [Brevibacterium sp. 50QC2O2]
MTPEPARGPVPHSEAPSAEDLHAALSRVIDPELRRDIVSLGMVASAEVDEAGTAHVEVLLTVPGCPLKDTISRDVHTELAELPGLAEVDLKLGVMSAEQRKGLREKLRAPGGKRLVPFTQPDSLTRVYAIASGKGGVGKSSLTANLAAAMAADGLRVGVVDADIHGFSIPGMFGLRGKPTKLDDMILPQVAHGVKVMSIGMFVDPGQAVVWRGPMLHRALEQFLTDVFWGDLDVLLLDLPPGTGDVAISVAQLLPNAELIVVTTPQQAAATVAERAGAIARQTKQRVAGVVENMSYLQLPDGTRMEVFGTGGGAQVVAGLARITDQDVPLLGSVPLEPKLREAADAGLPAVLDAAARQTPAALEISRIARGLSHRARGLAGRSLPLNLG